MNGFQEARHEKKRRHRIPGSSASVDLLCPRAQPTGQDPDREGKVAGFWLGLWHGLIAPITFIVSLFSNSVSLYEVHNSGGWYNFGFVLGAGLFLSGGILGRKKKK